MLFLGAIEILENHIDLATRDKISDGKFFAAGEANHFFKESENDEILFHWWRVWYMRSYQWRRNLVVSDFIPDRFIHPKCFCEFPLDDVNRNKGSSTDGSPQVSQ